VHAPAKPELRAHQTTGGIEPLSPRRYKVQLTAEQPLIDKLRQAQQLLSHQVPPGDLAAVLERALDALLPQLRRQRFAETDRPRKQPSPRQPKTPKVTPPDKGQDKTSPTTTPAQDRNCRHSRTIPAEVKRQVAQRDDHRCTFVDPASGRRCQQRSLLQYHHVRPWAKGGDNSTDNIFLMCAVHNRYLAELDYGADFIRRRVSGATRTPPPGQVEPSAPEDYARAGEAGAAGTSNNRCEAKTTPPPKGASNRPPDSRL
jgi:hypothetical protein